MTDDQPLHLSIGTHKAFKNGYAYDYDRHNTLGVYVCTKGSEHARTGEILVLKNENGEWIAWDSTIMVRNYAVDSRSSRAVQTFSSQVGMCGK